MDLNPVLLAAITGLGTLAGIWLRHICCIKKVEHCKRLFGKSECMKHYNFNQKN